MGESPTVVLRVKLLALMVEGAMSSLNVAVTKVLFAATALCAGTTLVTVGAVVSGATEVLKVQTLLVARALPARSVTVVLTVAVNEVLVGSGDGLVGVNVAVRASAEYATVPTTGVSPTVVLRVKLLALIVLGAMSSLKLAVTAVLLAATASCAGLTLVTVGAVVSGAELVVKDHTKAACRGMPPVSCAPVVMVATQRVDTGKLALGKKVATWPLAS